MPDGAGGAFQKRTVPLRQVGDRFVAALEESKQRGVGIITPAHRVIGQEEFSQPRIVTRGIGLDARLRKLLGQTRDGREYVVTAYGRGYRFIHEVAARSTTRGRRCGT